MTEQIDIIEGESTPQQVDYEGEAVKYGWKPADEWEGDGHIDAEKFMTRGPGLSRKQSDQIQALQKQVTDLTGAAERTEKSVTERVARTEKALKAAHDANLEIELKRVRDKQTAAVEIGDTEAFNEAKAEEDSLRKQPEPEPQNTVPESEKQEVDAWVKANPWFQTDPAMHVQATSVYNAALAMGKTNSEALAAAEQAVKDQYPSKFERPKPPAVDGGGLGAVEGGKKGWSDISREDRAQAQQFIDDGTFDALAKAQNITPREAYAKKYWSE